MEEEEAEERKVADEKTSSSSSSPSPSPSRQDETGHGCPICLGSFIQESYLDTCFHKFCFKCILQWSKVVAGKHSRVQSSVKCPLCKTESSSVIHGYDGASFVRHYLDRGVDSMFFTKAHKYRLQCYYTEPGVLNKTVSVLRFWILKKYLQPNQWLQCWLTREIQALIQDEDVDIIVHHIMGVVESSLRKEDNFHRKKPPEVKRQEFKSIVEDAARPFIAARTARFVDELEFFLASGLNVKGYDEVYTQQLGWSIPGISRMIREEEEDESDEQPLAATVPLLYISDDDCDETV